MGWGGVGGGSEGLGKKVNGTNDFFNEAEIIDPI